MSEHDPDYAAAGIPDLGLPLKRIIQDAYDAGYRAGWNDGNAQYRDNYEQVMRQSEDSDA